MDAMSDMVAILDPEYRIRRVNRALANRLGLAPEECVGLLCYRTLHGTDAPLAECPHVRMLTDHQEHTAEIHDSRTGSDYLITVSPLFDEHAQLSGCVHMARDITAKKRNEAALQQAHSLLRATLDATADGILVVDLQSRIVDYNTQFARLWRIPDEVLVNRDDAQALTFVRKQLKYPEHFFAKVQELYAHPEADSYDLIEFLDGRVFERYSRPQRLNGTPIGRVWCFRDVSERKKAETDLYHQMAFDAMATKFLARSARSSGADVDVHIRTSLEELGFFAEVDEVYITNYNYGTETFRVTHYWQAPNAPCQIHCCQEPLPLMTWLGSCVLDSKPVQLQTLDDMPAEAATDRERLARDGVVSMLLVPLRGKGGVVLGSLGLRSYTRVVQWMPEDIQRMRLLGDAITSGLERRRFEMALCESEIRLRAILETVQTGVVIVDEETHCIVDINTAAAILLGETKETLVGENYRRFFLQSEQKHLDATSPAIPSEDLLTRADGVCVPVLRTVAQLLLNNRRHTLESLADIRLLKQMEERVIQSQKMDAIGRLAGGVAHDFNNIVQVILGFSEIVLLTLAPDHPHRQNMQEIKNAALRAGDISRQLLSFSRSQPAAAAPLDLSGAVNENLKMLQSLLGEDIQITTRFEPDLEPIFANAGQISQVVLNLAVNARDAMPRGGQLTISTSAVTVAPHDTALLRHADAFAGDFACLTVSDNGSGMTDHVRAHIFEPFFTTKAHGKGTGLGLSVVYGIVKQSGGWIYVDSHPNAGATFRIFFPVPVEGRSEAPGLAEPATEAPAPRGHGERILLVEDDASVGRLMAKLLESFNYRVVVCFRAQEALARVQEQGEKFDLLFSDVVLPDRDGITLADELRALQPRLAVLLCSGYTDERSQKDTIYAKGYHYLPKPCAHADVLHCIQQLLCARQ